MSFLDGVIAQLDADNFERDDITGEICRFDSARCKNRSYKLRVYPEWEVRFEETIFVQTIRLRRNGITVPLSFLEKWRLKKTLNRAMQRKRRERQDFLKSLRS